MTLYLDYNVRMYITIVLPYSNSWLSDLLSVRMWGYLYPVYVRCSSVSVPGGAGHYNHIHGYRYCLLFSLLFTVYMITIYCYC